MIKTKTSGCIEYVHIKGMKYTLLIKDASGCEGCGNAQIRVRLYENDIKEKTGVALLLGAEFDIDGLAELMSKSESEWIWKKRRINLEE